MKDQYDSYLYTRDHRTPEERKAQARHAIISWIALIGFTVIVLGLAKIFLVP